jgi:hypothetical protein
MISSQTLNEHFGKQPTQKEINPEIASLLDQYGLRYRNITQKIATPKERAMVDLELLALEKAIEQRVRAHEMRTYALLTGNELTPESNENAPSANVPAEEKTNTAAAQNMDVAE